MITRSISEARRKLADLIELARQGEEVVIIKDSKPVAALTPIDASDFQRSSLFKKFVLYLEVEAQGIYRSHFGLPNLYVPIVTTNAVRLASMMRLLERITGGAGSKTILFKTFPAFTSPGRPPARRAIAP